MANTLTNLIPDALVALDTVSRELVGFIPSVARDPSADQVAIGQTLRVPQTAANVGVIDATPAMTLPSAADQTIGNKSLTITKNRMAPFSWSGEEQKAMSAGVGFLTLKQGQIAQAIRSVLNEMETDIAIAAKNGASRAWGTPGTAPFASTLADTANLKKILDDNGAPGEDRHLCLNSTAGVKVRTLTQLTNANQSGSTDPVRRGTLLDVHGFMFRESAKVQQHTKGTGANYLVDLVAGYAVGVTALHVDTGTGTILAGDTVTFTGDDNIYVIATGFAGDGDGDIVLAEPGLRKTLANDVAMTVGGSYAANIAHTRNSILLATRLRTLPTEGDLATEREEITDPLTGITLELAYYPGFGMGVYMVGCVWGVLVVKPAHVATLFG